MNNRFTAAWSILLGKAAPAAQSTPQEPTPDMMRDTVWAFTNLYGVNDVPRYNPDELVGRKGYRIYRRMLLDEQIKAVVRFKRDAITSRAWSFVCEHEELSEKERELRIKVMTQAVRQMKGSFTDTQNGIMSAMYMGFSMTEKVYKLLTVGGKQWYGIEHLRLKPAESFLFHTDEFGNLTKIQQRVAARAQDVDASKFIHYVQNPDVDLHYGQSELRECYRDYWSKDVIVKLQNIYLERFAAGFAWARPSGSKTLNPNTQEYRDLQSALSNINAITSMIVPNGVDLNLAHPTDTTAFDRALTRCDKGIAKSLLVPNLLGVSEQGQHGSLSQADTQLEAFLWTLETDTQRLVECLNEQLFHELGALNWGDELYPEFKLEPISEKSKMDIIAKWADLVQKGAVQASDTDEKHVRKLMDFPEKGTVNAQPTQPGAAPGAEPPVHQQPGQTPPAQQPPVNKGDGVQQNMEETIIGQGAISISHDRHSTEPLLVSKEAYSRALKRVDFAVIGSQSEDSSQTMAYDIAVVNSDAVKRITDGFKNGVTLADIPGIKFTSDELGKMKAVINAGLKDAWAIGEKHAARELAKASRAKKFALDAGTLMDLAAEFMSTKSFFITGNISGATVYAIQSTVAEGIKTSKTQAEIIVEIFKVLETDGMLTEEAVQEALGTTTVKNTKSRIATIARTASFEAINEARYATFSDPALAGFVEALEYSAILDNVTTEICRTLDGSEYAVNDPVWSTYRPPNHFNCRSLLIPITQRDTWTPSAPPSVEPQKGFGFTNRGE